MAVRKIYEGREASVQYITVLYEGDVVQPYVMCETGNSIEQLRFSGVLRWPD